MSFTKLVLRWTSPLALAGALACGGELQEQDETAAEIAVRLPEQPIFDSCIGEPSGWFEPYRTNPNTECKLVSKYNGDIDGGFDVGGGNYDAFKQCMTDAGCYNAGRGVPRSEACDSKLKECQTHLIGAAAAANLEMDRDFGTITADEWANFGQGL